MSVQDTVSKIPFLNLKKQYLQIKDEVLEKVEEVFSNTAFSGGKSFFKLMR